MNCLFSNAAFDREKMYLYLYFFWQWRNVSRWWRFTPAGEKLAFCRWEWQSRDAPTRQPDLGSWGLWPHRQNTPTRDVSTTISLSLKLVAKTFSTLNAAVWTRRCPAVTFPYGECRYMMGPSTWRTARSGSTSLSRDGTPALLASGSTTLGRAVPTTTSPASPLTTSL